MEVTDLAHYERKGFKGGKLAPTASLDVPLSNSRVTPSYSPTSHLLCMCYCIFEGLLPDYTAFETTHVEKH